MTSNTSARPSEQPLQDAIAKMRIKPLSDFLGSATEENAIHLAGMIERSSALIIKRPDDGKASAKQSFLSKLEEAYVTLSTPAATDAFRRAVRQLNLSGEGYRRILSNLASTSYASMPVGRRVPAVLVRAAEHAALLWDELNRAVDRHSYFNAQAIAVRDAKGRPLSPDAVNDEFAAIASNTLAMEARQAGWIIDEVVVIPSFPQLSVEDIQAVEQNDRTALAWRNWARVEEGARFEGGDITATTTPDGRTVFEVQNGPDRWHEYAAQARRNDRADQNILEISRSADLKGKVGDWLSGVPLPPDAYVDEGEIFGVGALSDVLGYAIKDDTQLIDGLRIIEWIRGLAVLSNLATSRENSPMPGQHKMLPTFTDAELIEALKRNALEPEKAATFIDQMTFRRDTLDLYDAPLIQIGVDNKILFSATVKAVNISGVLLSLFACKEVNFEEKGHAFEKRVLERLKAANLEAISYKTSREGQQYDFDVLLLWDDHLFVFECKNRSVPFDRPVQSRHFAFSVEGHAKQVIRLVGALKNWPDILTNAFGRPISPKVIVPVVLNNLPYARPGLFHGAYFYDFGALGRFLARPGLGARIAMPLGGGRVRYHDIDALRLWKADRPDAHDLMAQLEDPAQLHVLRHHTNIQSFEFPIDKQTIARTTQFISDGQSHYTLAGMAGLKHRQVRESVSKAAKKAKKERIKYDRREKLARPSPWNQLR